MMFALLAGKDGCLNPCCGGRCSSTARIITNKVKAKVLILVVVEDVLVPEDLDSQIYGENCLNPCCGGRCSSTRLKQ